MEFFPFSRLIVESARHAGGGLRHDSGACAATARFIVGPFPNGLIMFSACYCRILSLLSRG